MESVDDDDDGAEEIESSQNYIVFLLERARAGVKSYCRWSGGQSLRVGLSLHQCEINLPHVTASVPSELTSSQWISVSLTTSAHVQCAIYPMSLASSIGFDLDESKLQVRACVRSRARASIVPRAVFFRWCCYYRCPLRIIWTAVLCCAVPWLRCPCM